MQANFHHNIQRLRHLHMQPYRLMSTSANAKVLTVEHSPSVFEMKLNVPKTLNAVDTEMCDLMIE